MKIRRYIEHGAGWLLSVLIRTDTTLAEFWSSTMLLAWGIGFFLVPLPPHGNAIREIVEHLAEIGGLAFVSSGSLILGVSQSIGNLTHHRAIRRKAAFAAALWYGFLGLIGLHATPGAIFNRTAFVAALVSAVVYLRLSVPLPRPWTDLE